MLIIELIALGCLMGFLIANLYNHSQIEEMCDLEFKSLEMVCIGYYLQSVGYRMV